jgi:hypothetical protein
MTRGDHVSDLLDLTMTLHHQTDGAVLVSETGEEKKAVWLPKSKIEIEFFGAFIETGKTVNGVMRSGQVVMLPMIVVTLPEWLAIDKGLV